MTKTKSIPFRNQQKTALTVMVPVDLDDMIRREADITGCSMGYLVTTHLCKSLGIDPEPFGIFANRSVAS